MSTSNLQKNNAILLGKTELNPGFKIPSDWTLDERTMCDLELLLQGAFAPLKGFLGAEDYYSVLNNMCLKDGSLWPIPIVLPIPKTATNSNMHWQSKSDIEFPENQDLGYKEMRLRDKLGTIIAVINVTDVYEPNISLEIEKVLATTSLNHPYAQYLIKNHQGCYYLGGEVFPVREIDHFDFAEFRMSATESKEYIKKMGWKIVVGFQTRNPMHRSHFELTKQALANVSKSDKTSAHLLLTPAVGPTQPGDVDYVIRVRSYKRILKYYKENEVKMILLPIAMRMAGPREAVWHAIIRKNFGCTHFIVGRDHAGPSVKKEDGTPFYSPYASHNLLSSVQDKLGIRPIFGKSMVYVEKLEKYLPEDLCPPDYSSKTISGTELREMLVNRKPIPNWFTFPEVNEELLKFYTPPYRKGLCIYFTGLPCSGKSTLANAVESKLLEDFEEMRKVTILDADVVRTHLSKGLGFTQEDRSINVRRIGYVSSEITKHGGICLVANIAPYEEDRKYNRQIVTQNGSYYVEIYVSTPLEICEERDVKELYKKARQGLIKQFTGISDPYQIPKNAELMIDSTDDIYGKVTSIMNYLKCNNLVPTSLNS